MDLTEFLAARLDEEENSSDEIHEARICSGCRDGWEAGFAPAWCDCGYPARVLREVAAKRAILRMTLEMDRYSEWDDMTLGAVLEQLAAVYSHHPDYRPEWKP